MEIISIARGKGLEHGTKVIANCCYVKERERENNQMSTKLTTALTKSEPKVSRCLSCLLYSRSRQIAKKLVQTSVS